MYTYQTDGFEILDLLTTNEFAQLKNYGLSILQTLFNPFINQTLSKDAIEQYHEWGTEKAIPHSDLMSAKNRHYTPEDPIKSCLLNEKMDNFLRKTLGPQYKIWDEGLGWVGFRLVRPNHDDGYPFSCKNWGPAKDVLSMWIPIFGFDQEMMLHLVPGSHKKQYEKILPKESRFTKDEYRLASPPDQNECIRPGLKPGQAIAFHPNTIHEEKCGLGKMTRFSFEFRVSAK